MQKETEGEVTHSPDTSDTSNRKKHPSLFLWTAAARIKKNSVWGNKREREKQEDVKKVKD